MSNLTSGSFNMNKKILNISSSLIVISALLLNACASATPTSSAMSTVAATSTSTQVAGAGQTTAQAASVSPSGNPSSGNPPSGSLLSGDPGSGAAPGSGSSSSSSTQGLSTATGAYTLDGQTATQFSQTYTASHQDQSAVYVTNGGNLTLSDATITTSGNTSSTDNSSFYGLNAGVLVASGSSINMSDSSVSTTGTGANGVFATGSGSTVTLTNVKINATGDGGHGAMASNGGVLNLTNDDITTSGTSSAPIATDRGGGTITLSGGTTTTSGVNSPCLYSTGSFTINGLTCTATGSESAVIEGANSITLIESSLTSNIENKWGVMIYQSMSGDAQGTEGTFTMTGGSLSNIATTGPLFFVTNSTANITLKGVNIATGSGVLVEAGGTTKWGASGSNGGTVNLIVDSQTLTGNFVTDDAISSIIASLKNESSLTGAINTANEAKDVSLTLDASSTWKVTADSYLTCLTDTGISRTSVSNITGNGHTVYYNVNACSSLGGQTYTLNGGGSLKPSD
jgi:hypothetical protein